MLYQSANRDEDVVRAGRRCDPRSRPEPASRVRYRHPLLPRRQPCPTRGQDGIRNIVSPASRHPRRRGRAGGAGASRRSSSRSSICLRSSRRVDRGRRPRLEISWKPVVVREHGRRLRALERNDEVSATLPASVPLRADHFDVVIVGAGISGIGGAYHLTQAVSRQELRRARGARELRRNVAHAPVPGHPFRQRPVHVRLPVQAVDRCARSPPPPRSASTWARSSTRTISAATFATTTRSRARAGRAKRTSGPSTRRAPTPARRCGSRPASSGCARGTTGTRRATRPTGPAWTATRAGSSIRRRGPKTSTTRTRPLSSSVRAQPRPRSFPRSRPTARTSPCCSARRRTSSPARTATSWPTRCASWRSTRSGSTRSCAARSCTTSKRSRSCRSSSPSSSRRR